MKKTGLIYKNKSVFPVFLLLLLAVMVNAQQVPFKNPAINGLENKPQINNFFITPPRFSRLEYLVYKPVLIFLLKRYEKNSRCVLSLKLCGGSSFWAGKQRLTNYPIGHSRYARQVPG